MTANKANEYIKRKKAEAMLGVFCVKCGSGENLEYAHVRETGLSGRGRGRKERYYDVLRHPDAYIILCHSCHEVFDAIGFEEETQKANI